MAEGKKVEFKRETAGKAALELLGRVKTLNSADNEYYHVNNLLLFGSFVNTDRAKVHDLDVAIGLAKTPFYYQSMRETGRYSEEKIEQVKNAPPHAPYPEFERYCYQQSSYGNMDFVLQYCFLIETTMRRLKEKSKIFSFHTFSELSYGDIPESETLMIVSDGVIADDAEQRIKELSNITKGK